MSYLDPTTSNPTSKRPSRRDMRARADAILAWEAMRTRCQLRSGEGFKVTRRWRNLDNFVDDMGLPPAGYTLVRIDTSKSYCKTNCMWFRRGRHPAAHDVAERRKSLKKQRKSKSERTR